MLNLLLDPTTTSQLNSLHSVFLMEDTMMAGLEELSKRLCLSKDHLLLITAWEMLYAKGISVVTHFLLLLIQDFICPLWISHLLKHGLCGTGTRLCEDSGISGATSTIITEEELGCGWMGSQMETAEIDLQRFITYFNHFDLLILIKSMIDVMDNNRG